MVERIGLILTKDSSEQLLLIVSCHCDYLSFGICERKKRGRPVVKGRGAIKPLYTNRLALWLQLNRRRLEVIKSIRERERSSDDERVQRIQIRQKVQYSPEQGDKNVFCIRNGSRHATLRHSNLSLKPTCLPIHQRTTALSPGNKSHEIKEFRRITNQRLGFLLFLSTGCREFLCICEAHAVGFIRGRPKRRRLSPRPRTCQPYIYLSDMVIIRTAISGGGSQR